MTNNSNGGVSSLIITKILRDKHVTLAQLETRANERGVSLDDLYNALDAVHRDRRIKRGVKGGEVYYTPAPPKATPVDHTAWVRAHYPWPGRDDVPPFIMPFPEIDMSWMFLRTREERDEYKAAAKGVPQYMIKSRHG